MKPLFSLLISIAIILAFSFLTTAVSCGSAGGGNNNSSGDGGGDGNGGDGSGIANGDLTLTFDEKDDDAVKIVGSEIRIKASAFPETVAANANKPFRYVVQAPEETKKKIFRVSLDGSTGGFLLVGGGSVAVDKFSTTAFEDTWWDSGRDSDNSGVQTPSPSGGVLKIYSVFADKRIPDAATADKIFAFTPRGGPNGTQPIFYCVAAAFKFNYDPAQTLKGGEKADCYIGSVGAAALGGAESDNVVARDAWLKTAASTTFKKSFRVTFAGISTDDKPILEIGLEDKGNPDPKDRHDAVYETFRFGVDQAEMGKIVAKAGNKYGRREMTLTIVNNRDFASGGNNGGGDSENIAQMSIVIPEENKDKVKIVGNEIRIKNGAFSVLRRNRPWQNTGDEKSDYFGRISLDGRSAVKKIFEVTFSDFEKATGGLVLAGNGDFEGFSNFSAPAPTADFVGGDKSFDKGIHMFNPRTAGKGLLDSGLNFFSIFADQATVAATSKDPNVAPFAFTTTPSSVITGQTSTYKPVFFCKTKVPTITATVQATDRLTGGQTAECFISYMQPTYVSSDEGVTNGQDAWMATPSSDTFKKEFNVTFAGIKTDQKTIAEIVPGAGPVEKVAKFNNGLSTADMREIVDAGIPTGKINVKIKVVNHGDFLADGDIPNPPQLDIRIINGNLVKVITEQSGKVIHLKSQHFPAAAAMASTENFRVDMPNMIHAFNMVIYRASGGLVLAGGGNQTISQFTTEGQCGNNDSAYNSNTCFAVSAEKKGTILDDGLNLFGNFMDKATPGANVYSFTATDNTSVDVQDGTQPIIICKTLITPISDNNSGLAGAVESTSVFNGGHEARCYVGSVGAMGLGNGTARTKWFNTAKAGGNNFKSLLEIAFVGIKTDGRPFSDMGWLGRNDTEMENDFINGIDAATMRALIANNPTAYKKVRIQID